MRARYSERTRKKRRDKKRLPGLRPTLTDQRIALGIAAPGYKRDARCTTGSYSGCPGWWAANIPGSNGLISDHGPRHSDSYSLDYMRVYIVVTGWRRSIPGRTPPNSLEIGEPCTTMTIPSREEDLGRRLAARYSAVLFGQCPSWMQMSVLWFFHRPDQF